MKASVKFNGGNTLLLVDVPGAATLVSLGLATQGEVDSLRTKLAATEETIRKLHSIAWPRGGDLNGDPESDLLLMVGTFKCAISEMESKLAAAEKERDEAVMLNRRIETVEQSAAERIDRAEANDSLSRKGWQDALAQVATLTAERDEWRRLSGMDCDGMNCPPSEELKAQVATLTHELDLARRGTRAKNEARANKAEAQVATLMAELFEAKRGATTTKVFATEKHAALAPTLRAIRELIVCPHPDIYGAREKIDGLLKMLVSP